MVGHVTGSVILQRAEAIRLPLKHLAKEAGVSEHTVKNFRRQRSEGATENILQRCLEVIERHERKMRNYLNKLIDEASNRSATSEHDDWEAA